LPYPGVWVSPWRDDHDAARLLLPEVIQHHPVKGDTIALIPNRNTLILTGSQDEAGLAQMAAMGKKIGDHPTALSRIPLRYDGKHWLPFLPD